MQLKRIVTLSPAEQLSLIKWAQQNYRIKSQTFLHNATFAWAQKHRASGLLQAGLKVWSDVTRLQTLSRVTTVPQKPPVWTIAWETDFREHRRPVPLFGKTAVTGRAARNRLGSYDFWTLHITMAPCSSLATHETQPSVAVGTRIFMNNWTQLTVRMKLRGLMGQRQDCGLNWFKSWNACWLCPDTYGSDLVVISVISLTSSLAEHGQPYPFTL